jgi:hypothetical protein
MGCIQYLFGEHCLKDNKRNKRVKGIGELLDQGQVWQLLKETEKVGWLSREILRLKCSSKEVSTRKGDGESQREECAFAAFFIRSSTLSPA